MQCELWKAEGQKKYCCDIVGLIIRSIQSWETRTSLLPSLSCHVYLSSPTKLTLLENFQSLLDQCWIKIILVSHLDKWINSPYSASTGFLYLCIYILKESKKYVAIFREEVPWPLAGFLATKLSILVEMKIGGVGFLEGEKTESHRETLNKATTNSKLNPHIALTHSQIQVTLIVGSRAVSPLPVCHPNLLPYCIWT